MNETRILIVEDEVIAAKSLELRLTRLGYTVVGIAFFGEDALQLATSQRANLVLMDINLRGAMDGIQAAERIRTQLQIPVIYTTAHDDDATLHRAKITDPFGYLVKPFETREIRAAIEMALYKHDAEQKLRASEQRHRLISDLISDIAYSARVHPNGATTIDWLAGQLQDMFGYSIEEINAHGSILFAVHPDDVALVQARFQELHAGTSRVDEYRIITQAGETRWIRHYVRPVWDEQEKRVTHFYGAAQDITDRIQAQAALQERETRYRIVAEQNGQLVYEYDLATGAIEWHGTILELTGYSRDEFNRLGIAGWEAHLHPDDAPAACAALELAQQQGAQYTTTYRFRRKDGAYLDMEDTGIFLRDARGIVHRMVGAMKDVSERRRAELALANERALLRTVLDHLPDRVMVKDRQARYVLNNTAHLRLIGVARQEDALGKTAADFFPAEEAAHFTTLEQQIERTGEPVLNQEELVSDRETHSQRWHLNSKIPLRDATGALIGLVGISRDITERKLAQDELAREKVLFEQLFENAPLGIVMLDEQDRVRRINSAFERIFQYASAEIVGKPINALIVPASHNSEGARLSRTVLRGNTVHHESIRQRRDGSLVPVEVYGVPVTHKNKTLGLYAMYVDITERKRVEEQLQFASTHDALTGIFNRAYFETELEHLRHSTRFPVSIVMVDVDRLKHTNDTLGHAAGDELLCRAANLLQAAFRADDIVARIGGDEFAVILPCTDQAAAAQALARVREMLDKNNDAPPVALSFSMGVATAHHMDELPRVIIAADTEMYQDKLTKHL